MIDFTWPYIKPAMNSSLFWSNSGLTRSIFPLGCLTGAKLATLWDIAWRGRKGSGQAGARLPPAPPEPTAVPPAGSAGSPWGRHQGLAVSFQFSGSDLSSGVIPAFPCHLAPGLDLVFNNLCLGSSTVSCKCSLFLVISWMFLNFYYFALMKNGFVSYTGTQL